MSKDDFSNNEILLMFKEIQTTLDRIEVQAVKTNGRVTVLETRASNLELWKESLMARIATVIAVVSVLWVAFKELILNK